MALGAFSWERGRQLCGGTPVLKKFKNIPQSRVMIIFACVQGFHTLSKYLPLSLAKKITCNSQIHCVHEVGNYVAQDKPRPQEHTADELVLSQALAQIFSICPRHPPGSCQGELEHSVFCACAKPAAPPLVPFSPPLHHAQCLLKPAPITSVLNACTSARQALAFLGPFGSLGISNQI